MLEALSMSFDSLVVERHICLPHFREKMLVIHIDCN